MLYTTVGAAEMPLVKVRPLALATIALAITIVIHILFVLGAMNLEEQSTGLVWKESINNLVIFHAGHIH